MKPTAKPLRKSSTQIATAMGKHRLRLVQRRGKAPKPDLNVRFASKEQHAQVKAAAKRANESMSQFMLIASLERAAQQLSQHFHFSRPHPISPAV